MSGTVEFFFIPLIIFPFILYDTNKEKREFFVVIIATAAVLFLAVLTKIIGFEPILSFDKKTHQLLNIAFVFTSMIGTFILTYIFTSRVEHSLYKTNQRNLDLQIEIKDLSAETQKLINANKEKEQLLGISNKLLTLVSHDVRQPINTMISISDILLSSEISKDEQRMLAKKFKESSIQTSQMLENFLAWTYSQRNGIVKTRSKVIIAGVVKKIGAEFQYLLQTKHIRLDIDCESAPTITTDSFMLEIVLRNLIHNAVKYSAHGSAICIVTRTNGKYIYIDIQDEGVGIDEKYLDTLFDTSIKQSQPGTANEKGAGIGLLLCKEFVEMNHGTISVKNSLIKGVTMTLQYPI